MSLVSVIVPVYYNEGSLQALSAELHAVERELQQQGCGLELIFVDDGSGDNSFAELLKIKQQHNSVKIVRHTKNFGSMRALKTGLQFVQGDCFLFLSADLQDPPRLILDMVAKWKAGSKFVICAREKRKDPALSRLAAHLYYLLLRTFVVGNYPAGGFDLALMDKSLLCHLKNSNKNINIPLFAYWLGFTPAVINYTRQKRESGRSRWTFRKKLNFFLDSMVGFSILPIRVISLCGVLISLCSFLYGLFILYNAFFGDLGVRGFPTIVTLISFFSGLIMVMLGTIGEYVWRIFDETGKRPESVVEQVVE
jgi:dolichol-phosphate mannosyltransferase